MGLRVQGAGVSVQGLGSIPESPKSRASVVATSALVWVRIRYMGAVEPIGYETKNNQTWVLPCVCALRSWSIGSKGPRC